MDEILNNLNEDEAINSSIRDLKLNNFGLLSSVLRKSENYHFFKDLVSNPSRVRFDANPETFSFERIKSKTGINKEGSEYFEFIIKLSISGNTNEWNEAGFQYVSTPFTLQCYAQFLHWKNLYGIIRDTLRLFDDFQYHIILIEEEFSVFRRHKNWKFLYEMNFDNEEYFSFYSNGLWNKEFVDKSPKRKDVITHVTDYYYLNELNTLQTSIVYALYYVSSLSKSRRDFKNNYNYYSGQKMYNLELNIFEVRYFYYLSHSLELIYSFWERLAFLISSFVNNPSPRNLSFKNLFNSKSVVKLQQRYQSMNNSNLDFFLKRANGKHLDLMDFRHPFIHYQIDNTDFRGSIVADLYRGFSSNFTNDAKITEFTTYIQKMEDFCIEELDEIFIGFENAVNLIKSINEPFD